MANEHIKRFSTSLIIREIQIKTTVRYYFTCVRMAIISKSTNNKLHILARMWRKENVFALLVECRSVQPLWKTIWRYLKILKNGTTFWPSDATSGNISEGTQNTNLKEHKHLYVHCSVVHITKIWKSPKCPSVDEWIKHLWDIYTMEYTTQL
ncbi:hypothetical protein HJG60_010624 [Phyllostomus discolor]|uniref:Uncharacterized protein n=1 Tax=Phyllostomus discolor TaxID=89673 RepID=A0A834EEZ4_9CHIR|nr:hypothetical protein HJG60_010624 [Phyllostomus discolor]